MSFIASAIVGAGALGAGASIYGAQTAANAQTSAANAGISAQEQMYQQGLQQQQGYVQQGTQALNPLISGGNSAMQTLLSLLTPGANQTAVLSQIPGLQFTQDWGQKAVQNSATTSGLGGNVLAGVAQYATGLAQQGFGGIVSGLQGLLGSGTSAASSLASLLGGAGNQALSTSSGVGGNIASLTSNIGDAQAGAAIGTANAVGGFGNSIAQTALLSKLFPNMFGGNAGVYGTAIPGAVGPTSYGGPEGPAPLTY